MCGAARKGGDLTVLFPKGAETYQEIPWFLYEAINQAFVILSWYENFVEKEVPPPYLWEDAEGLEMWFKRVSDEREWTSGGDTVPDEEDMMGNEFARAFRS